MGRTKGSTKNGTKTMVNIRPAHTHEIPHIAAIHEQTATVAYAHIFPNQPFPRTETITRWQNFPGQILIAEVENVSVGFAAFDAAELHALYVMPNNQGQGIGRRLLVAAGAVSLLWVLKENHAARRFYAAHGWVPDGTARMAFGVVEMRYQHAATSGYEPTLLDDPVKGNSTMKNVTVTEEAARLNRQAWDSIRRQRDDGLIATHHDVAAEILAGTTILSPQQRQLAGDVAGKSLLDLGCGDGFELLEWALAGAHVTGVDNSPLQLAAAQHAATQLSLSCRFVQTDLLTLPENLLQTQFDIVFSAWVTAWIGDLQRWFTDVALALKLGGIFLLSGRHPLADFFAERAQSETARMSYFQEGPFYEKANRSVTWNPAAEQYTTIEWKPTLGNIVTAIAQSGLRTTHLLELGDTNGKDGLIGVPGEFLIRATKEG